jgi:cyclase
VTNSVRIIPRLDIKGPNLIKGIQFDGHRVLGTAEEFAETYYREGADELFYQDAVASLYRRNGLTDVVKRMAEKVFIPITVAGGVRSVDDVRMLIRSGADKVAINTAALENPALIHDAAKMFGSQCIVSSIEAFHANGRHHCWMDYGREPTPIEAVEWAARVVDLGAGEIFLTSINKDGMGSGYDLELIHQVSSRVSVPIVACGGAGDTDHLVRAVLDAGADAVSAASLFHYHYATPKPGRRTMQSAAGRLRAGESLDTGNIDFLNHGYGGERAIMVRPASIRTAKRAMMAAGVRVRGPVGSAV